MEKLRTMTFRKWILISQIAPAAEEARRSCLRGRLPFSRSSTTTTTTTTTTADPSPTPSSQEELGTVFTDLVQSMVPDAPSRQALFQLRRSLASTQHPSEFASVLSRHAVPLLKPQSWLFFLQILQHGSNPAHAIQAFEWKMVQPNASFIPQEYALVIRVAGKLGMLQKAKNLYHGMPSRGVDRSIDVENAIMYAHAYDSRNNDCTEALNVFKRLQDSTDGGVKPNITSFNIALSCYSKLRHLQYLEKTFEDLVGSGSSPSLETCNCMMLAYRRLGYWWRVEEIFCMFQSTSLNPNALTFGTLIKAYAAAGLLDRMEKAYEAMLSHGYLLKGTTAEVVISAYKKAGEFAKMERILFSLKARCSQRWMSNIMLKSDASNGRIESMEALIDEMLRSKSVPFTNQLAATVVKTYFRSGDHEKIRNFVEVAKCKKWHINRSFFNTLIYLYAENEGYTEMEWYFERMVASGCQPNHRTFQIMHRAYLKANMEDAAQDVITKMQAMGLSQI